MRLVLLLSKNLPPRNQRTSFRTRKRNELYEVCDTDIWCHVDGRAVYREFYAWDLENRPNLSNGKCSSRTMHYLCGVRLYPVLPDIANLFICSPGANFRLLFRNAWMNVHEKDITAHAWLLGGWFSYVEQLYKPSGMKYNLKRASWNNYAAVFYLNSKILSTNDAGVICHVKFLRAPIDHYFKNEPGTLYGSCNNTTGITRLTGWSRETYWARW